jgi:hypothetical protein
MKSPFPGMDPYLERYWGSVHGNLLTYIQESLQPQLPRDLRARQEQQVLLETMDASATYEPDITVVESGSAGGTSTSAAAVAYADAVVVRHISAPRKHRWVQIIDVSDGNRVVTVVEVLSKSNKSPGADNLAYCRKLDSYSEAGVNVVEIDLLRYPGRGRMPFGQIDLPANLRHPYLAGVRRGWAPEDWLVFPMSLRQPLKSIPVPLRRRDPEVMLDLQSLIERTYITGGHDDIDYSKPPDPPLEADDAVWAKTIVENCMP